MFKRIFVLILTLSISILEAEKIPWCSNNVVLDNGYNYINKYLILKQISTKRYENYSQEEFILYNKLYLDASYSYIDNNGNKKYLIIKGFKPANTLYEYTKRSLKNGLNVIEFFNNLEIILCKKTTFKPSSVVFGITQSKINVKYNTDINISFGTNYSKNKYAKFHNIALILEYYTNAFFSLVNKKDTIDGLQKKILSFILHAPDKTIKYINELNKSNLSFSDYIRIMKNFLKDMNSFLSDENIISNGVIDSIKIKEDGTVEFISYEGVKSSLDAAGKNLFDFLIKYAKVGELNNAAEALSNLLIADILKREFFSKKIKDLKANNNIFIDFKFDTTNIYSIAVYRFLEQGIISEPSKKNNFKFRPYDFITKEELSSILVNKFYRRDYEKNYNIVKNYSKFHYLKNKINLKQDDIDSVSLIKKLIFVRIKNKFPNIENNEIQEQINKILQLKKGKLKRAYAVYIVDQIMNYEKKINYNLNKLLYRRFQNNYCNNFYTKYDDICIIKK